MVWLTLAALAGEACLPGRVSTSGTCCWPGQDVVSGVCSGAPSCPAGTVVSGQGCTPVRAVGAYDPRSGEGVSGTLSADAADRLFGTAPPPADPTGAQFALGGRSVTTGGAPVILGGLGEPVISAGIHTVLPRALACATGDGLVTVKFTVSAGGMVTSASVKNSTFGDAAVAECARRAFAGLGFPPPAGGGIVIVVVPLLFGPA